MIGNSRYTEIIFSGWIQVVIMKEKNPFCVSSKINCFKYNVKPAHWVGHSKLRSLDTDNLFKRTPKFYENQASITGNTEEEENLSEETNYDAD